MKINDYPVKKIDDLAEYGVFNNMIEKFDLSIIGHFGNTVSLEVCLSNCCAFGGYSDALIVGLLIKALVEILGLTEEEGLRLSKIRNIPCRAVSDSKSEWGSKVIGIGHFMQDKFILVEDLRAWALEKVKEYAKETT